MLEFEYETHKESLNSSAGPMFLCFQLDRFAYLLFRLLELE